MNIVVEKKTRRKSAEGFYTSAEASRLAVVPRWTLNNWRRNGIIIPTVTWIDENQITHMGHTFETVVFIKLLRMLRDSNISLFKAVNALRQLRERFGPPSPRWADAKIFADKKEVFVYEESDKDEWGTTVITRYNQRTADIIFGEEFIELKKRADALLVPNEFLGSVEMDPSIQNGHPIICETTIPTASIHDLVDQGYQFNDIHNMYPFIPVKNIIGAEEYESYLDKVNSHN